MQQNTIDTIVTSNYKKNLNGIASVTCRTIRNKITGELAIAQNCQSCIDLCAF